GRMLGPGHTANDNENRYRLGDHENRSRMPVAVELQGVTFAYPQGPPVLADVDLRVDEGEFVAIAGPNGGGKTTLLRLILGLERPTRGRVELLDERAIGYLAQRSKVGVHAPATVRDVVEAGRAP